jgi:hypothetical protein
VNPIEQIILAWEGLRRSLRHAGAGSLWVPWILLASVQLAALCVLIFFAHPAFSWFMAPLLESAGGDALLRYPNLFRVLPGLYGRAALVISALVGAVLGGAAVWLFARRLQGRPASSAEGLGRALRRAPALVIANLPATALVTLMLTGLESVLAAVDGPRLIEQAARYGGLAMAILLQAIFAYVSADVMLGGGGVGAAWRALGERVASGYWAALVLSVTLFLPHLPSYWLGRLGGTVVQRGTPELMAALVGVEIALGAVTSWMMSGAVALVYLSMDAAAESPS